MAEVREPSPDDDVIALGFWRAEHDEHMADLFTPDAGGWRDGNSDWHSTGELTSIFPRLAVYVPASRLAAAEAQRDEARRMLAEWDRKVADWQGRFQVADAQAVEAEAALKQIRSIHHPIHDDPNFCAACSTSWPCSSRVYADRALADTAPEETSTESDLGESDA